MYKHLVKINGKKQIQPINSEDYKNTTQQNA